MKRSNATQTSYEWGILWIMLSGAFLSFSILFLKINLLSISYLFLLFLRFSGPLCIIILLIAAQWRWRILISSSSIGLQLGRSFCVLVSQYGIAFYIVNNSLLNATVLLNAAPLFIPVIEWIFLGHKPGKSTIVGALLSFLGVLLILQPDQTLFTAASGVGIAAALGQAGSQVLYGLKSKSENLLSSLFYLFFFTTLVSLSIFLIVDEPVLDPSNLKSESVIIVSVFLMSIGTLFNQYFRGLAYRCGRPSTLATFLYFAVFVSALFDWLIFKNPPTTLSVIGSSLIILGGVLKVFMRARILKNKKK